MAAVCTALDPGTRARGVADFTAQEDAHTDWISQTGRTYYSPWRAYIWKPPTHRMEYKSR